MTSVQFPLTPLREAIVRVGDGRGFLVAHAPWPPYVVTAAHCLPQLPPAHAFSFTEERTYPNLLGPLGEPPTVWAECVFVDPIADVAVLDAPDGQALCEEAEAYEAFTDGRPAIRPGLLVDETEAWLQTLDGHWKPCTVRPAVRGGSRLTLIDAGDGNRAGCSGSPIMLLTGRAVGVVVVGSETLVAGVRHIEAEQSGQPSLVHTLPGWLLTQLRLPKPPRPPKIDLSALPNLA